MKLFEAMNKNVITVKKEVTILDVMKLMREKEIGFIIIFLTKGGINDE